MMIKSLRLCTFACIGLFLYSVAAAAISSEYPTPSSANCTWEYIEQPLSHFARSNVGTYQQRLCVYSEYWESDQGLPVFFYTGNESPVEEYVNNTGLMWMLAAEFNALVVFAEHRYFGESVPEIDGMPNCLSYLSSDEALADYAAIVNAMRREWGVGDDAAVVAFGGSYGGMLASWMRILYPSAIDGAIAASAPIWGFPLTDCEVDSSAKVVTYAASAAAGAAPSCPDNLKSSYVLISDIGSTGSGRALLSDAMNLCTPLQTDVDITALLSYLQTPLFDLAEGSYPFPTDYITFALTSSTAPLPPWPMQVMCESLADDFGVTIVPDAGSEDADVLFTVVGKVYDGSGEVAVHVDWDSTSNNGYTEKDVHDSGILDLLKATSQAIQVWYNVTGEAPSCIDWQAGAAPNSDADKMNTVNRKNKNNSQKQFRRLSSSSMQPLSKAVRKLKYSSQSNQQKQEEKQPQQEQQHQEVSVSEDAVQVCSMDAQDFDAGGTL